ncbi:GGDEF domain-containing protein [Permianibacter aggregans]|uniref:diguanylate cyclase n=1 Tax=Permianibacter aggregans TaxID=1510150 RepID=A0A4R6V4Q9_9GAMM|nr:GGDEF domain-containing protein [Permianibacter aggregans]TDQ51144.1 diguanylate cyclase (GGDEF)-like protein [Permianibacter aggregans]
MNTRASPLLNRLQTDFQLAIISVFGACTVAVISPFAAYRFLSGNFWVGVLDTLLVLLIGGVVVYAWRSGNNERAGRVLVLVSSVGACASSELLGVAGLFWMSTAIVTNFFLTRHRLYAATITLAAIIFLVVDGRAFSSVPQMVSFTATALLLGTLSYIISFRYDLQHRKLEQLATRDPLTGALNRRIMTVELQRAVDTFKRDVNPVSLILIDLDHFKQINDRHGHDAGDQVLVRFAHLASEHIRQVDRFFRFGGEEFLLLLPNTDWHGAEHFAEKLRQQMEQDLKSPGGRVTISIGAAVLKNGEDWPCWLARADAALYKAKSLGRNRAELDEHGAPHSPEFIRVTN